MRTDDLHAMGWREANRANWDERVAVHLQSPGYELTSLRAGRGRLNAIEEAELGPVDGLRILHLQCHFGRDSLTLAQRGAELVGLDFSRPAIATARRLAAELGLSGRARFVEADLYDAASAIPERGFDLVFTTWGTICWLPDIRRWADIIAQFLRPGGTLYFADGHPAACVFDDMAKLPCGMPSFFAPYFAGEPIVVVDPSDYADKAARLENATQYNWMHPLAEIIACLSGAGLRLEWLHEHPSVPWQMFGILVRARRRRSATKDA